MALFAPVIAPIDPLAPDFYQSAPPSSKAIGLETDPMGRDLFSRIVWGLPGLAHNWYRRHRCIISNWYSFRINLWILWWLGR